MDGLKKLMLKHNLGLAVAESLTSGNLQAEIGKIDGASEFFLGGITAYNLTNKVKHLGVDFDEAAETNCVSVGVVQDMAQGAIKMFDADISIATTGYASPYPAAGADVPYAFYSIYHGEKEIITEQLNGEGLGRQDMQKFVTEKALGSLIGYLSDLEA